MEPIDPTWTIQQAIFYFYDQNKFGENGGATKKWAWIKFGFFSIPIPNIKSRQEHIFFHDLNHIVTDSDTTWKGESSVSAWEVASGGWGNLYYLWLLTLWVMGFGVIFYPKTIFFSFKKGLNMRNAFRCNLTKEQILPLRIIDLRNQLSNFSKSHKNIYFWMGISLFVFFIPFIISGVFILIILNIV